MTYIATVSDVGYYRVFDDSGEDYMYFQDNPRPIYGGCPGGRWEIVEDMDDRERELYEKSKKPQAPTKETLCLKKPSKYARNMQSSTPMKLKPSCKKD